jgi:hypothetical protein
MRQYSWPPLPAHIIPDIVIEGVTALVFLPSALLFVEPNGAKGGRGLSIFKGSIYKDYRAGLVLNLSCESTFARREITRIYITLRVG